MPPRRNARDGYCRSESVRKNRKNFVLWELARKNASERPRLDRMSGRKRVAAPEERDVRAPRLRSRPLRDHLHRIHDDFGIRESFNAETREVACAWVAVRLAVEVERGGHGIQGVVGAEPRRPLADA